MFLQNGVLTAGSCDVAAERGAMFKSEAGGVVIRRYSG
jgi:hypothetical protein